MSIGRLEADGQVNLFPLPSGDPNPPQIVTGKDGSLWFEQSNFGPGTGPDEIGRITPGGAISEFVVPALKGPKNTTTR